jgi:hypothetical protein
MINAIDHEASLEKVRLSPTSLKLLGASLAARLAKVDLIGPRESSR